MSAPVTRRRALGLACALGLVAVGCERLDGPADPVWGKQPCAHCAMLVGERRYAAQLVTETGRSYFDDIGCMVLWDEQHPGEARGRWVRDAEGGRWLEAEGARYLGGAKSPMDFGFEGRAAAVSGPEGRDLTVTWRELRAAVLGRDRGGARRSE